MYMAGEDCREIGCECKLDETESRLGLMAGFCEHGNGSLFFIREGYSFIR
jgi:hypothetical protein